MNALDYIKERGDLSFKADPFNEVDNLVFSQLIYANFDRILKKDDRLSIQQLGELYLKETEKNLKLSQIFGMDGLRVLKTMMNTVRYKDCMLYNYESLLHADTAEQFAACMIDLPDRTTVICFKGTDESLIGWKEDCYLSYKKIASQDDAVLYLNQHCSIFRKYRIIGHSKGGNLAIYAALHCKPLLRNRIIQVISNDGPGLRPGSYDEKEYEKIKDRYELIVPEKDGVGTIFEMAPKRTIAKVLTRNIVEAHSILSWQVRANRIERANADSFQTDKTRIALLRFLNDSTDEQKEIFTEELFKAMKEAGIESVTQLASGGLPVFLKVIKELAEMDSVARGIAIDLAKTFSISVSSGLRLTKKVHESAGNIKAKAKHVEMSLASKLIEDYLNEMKENEKKKEK
ncbi:MAG: DUF2974 domain-containing protein [Erysipelotrichaceae bacterium]|nr:DUF2974 domain-containing protein [Erysipelotrichaceae bacterium]